MKKIIVDLYKNLSPCGFAWIDLDKGQLTGYSDRPPVDFPCCLIRLSLTADDINSDEQLCALRIELKIAFDNLTGQTDIYAPEAALQKSFEQLDLLEKVHNRMQGFTTERMEECSRKSQTPVDFMPGIAGFNIVYESGFTEEIE